MLTPLLGLILGIAILVYAVSAYKGNSLTPIPLIHKQKGDLIGLTGWILVAIALMLGIVGYFNYINAVLLRYLRIIIGSVGLLLLSYQIGKILVGNYFMKQRIGKASLKQQIKHYVRSVLLEMISVARGIGRRVKRWLPLSEQWWAKFDLLRTLVRRDLEARYKGSVLGNLWPLLNQLSQLLIYTYVFSVVLRVKLSLQGLPENNLTYGLWLFAGLLPWIAFTGGLSQAANSVLAQANLVKKVVFPLALLPLVPILSVFIESSFGLMALIVLIAVTTQTLHTTLGLLPLVWLPQLLFTAGLGYLAAGLTVFLRDIPQTLGVILNIWLYLSPIIYPATAIPAQWRPWVFWLNPMAAIAEVYRDLILVGQINHWGEWMVASIVAIVVFCGGLWCYQRLRPAFADVL